MLDINKIKQLVDMMVANDLTEIALRDGDVEVNLRRPMPPTTETMAPQANPTFSPNPALGMGVHPVVSASPGATSPPAADTTADVELTPIHSPMVGTFYAAPDPESPPFVRVGSRVDSSAVVCIIEAMKVMNEIKAECTGTLVEVCVKNTQPVEYGQVLFRVRPS